MAIASRLTYLGAPESLQAAVAGGLCGMATTFAGTAEGAARMLTEAMPQAPEPDLAEVAARVVADARARHAVPAVSGSRPRPGASRPRYLPSRYRNSPLR